MSKTRIVMELREASASKLKELQEMLGHATKVDVFRTALRLLYYVVQEEVKGRELYIGGEDEDTLTKIKFI